MDNIGINEETMSGMGTTHVFESVIYQEEQGFHRGRTMRPPVDKTAIRMKSVKHVAQNELLECQNKFKQTVEQKHPKGKIDAEMWLVEEKTTLSLKNVLCSQDSVP